MAANVAGVDLLSEDSAAPFTVTKPAAFASGDGLVVVHVADGGVLADLTAAAGWVSKGTFSLGNLFGKVWSRAWAGGEPATWDFGYNAGSDTALIMVRVAGFDPANTVVVASTTMTSTSSMDSPTVTPTGADDLLLCFLANLCSGTALGVTKPASMTSQGQAQVAGNFQALAAASEQLASSSPTGVRTWTSCTPTGISAATVSIAVKSSTTAADGEPTAPVQLPPALLFELVARQQQLWTPADPPPDVPPQFIAATYRCRLARVSRRGGTFPLPPAQAAAQTPTWIPDLIRQDRRAPNLARRGEFLVIPATLAVPPPALIEGRRALRPPARRGEVQPVPFALPVPPPFLATRRKPAAPARRGDVFPGPVPPPPAGGTQDLPPSLLARQAPRRVPAARRRSLFFVPLVGAAPAAPPAVPAGLIDQTHTRPAAARRGRFLTVPASVPTPPPALIEGRRPAVPSRRRGTFARVVAVVGQPAPVLSRRRRPRPTPRRGQFLPPRLIGLDVPPPAPSTWTPGLLARRRTRSAQRPRRAFGTVWCTCTVTRPSTGGVARPSTGTVAYGGATVTRPSTGVVTRPNTGIVEDPCC